MGSSGGGTSYIKLLDSNGNAVEAQTAYDAAMSGPIYVTRLSSNASSYVQSNPNPNRNPNPTITEETYIPLFLLGVIKNSGTMVSAIFGPTINTSRYFYAGTDPSTLG